MICIPETLHCLPQQVGWWAWMLLHANLKQPQPKLHPLAVHWSTVEARWQALALRRLQPMTQSLSLTETTSHSARITAAGNQLSNIRQVCHI